MARSSRRLRRRGGHRHRAGAILIGDGLGVRAPREDEGKVVGVARAEGGSLYLQLSTAPERPGVDDMVPVCLGCLIDRHPEGAAGLELVKRAGDGSWAAVDDNGEWGLGDGAL